MISQRFERLHNILTNAGLDAVAINPGPTLSYLTGLSFHLMERPTVLIFAPPAAPVIVLPVLEMAKLASCSTELKAFSYGDNPASWADAFQQAAAFLGLKKASIGVEPERLRVLELRFLETAFPDARIVASGSELGMLRIQKDDSEVAAMRQAVKIAQAALSATLPAIKIGVSEREIASELTFQLLRAGSDAEVPFAPIVSSGPNSANPHASPSSRRLQSGDMLVIDWGGAYNGYISDLTRTFGIAEIEPEYKRIYELVKQANQAGRECARPGIPAGDIDRAARAVIANSGYGPQFFHRVGHGIGMEGHEPPYMFAENTLILQPGMAFTVEPGIYLADRGGVRIEDNVVITAQGAEILSDYSRELTILG